MEQFAIPPQVRRVLGLLEAKGYEGYVVGGVVRDLYLGRPPHDWDICTNATPQETIAAVAPLPVIKTGLQHGTVTVVIDRVGYEVTTYRTDGAYSDGRHPDSVSFVKNLREDLCRRDFTMNAMAYNPREGIVDLFHGREDIQKGLVRCVGNPQERFTEDVLRTMRAVRFASVFSFGIEEETALAVHRNAPDLYRISIERVCAEFRKMIQGPGFSTLAREYVDLLTQFLPELGTMVGFDQRNPWHHLDLWEHTLVTWEGCHLAGGDEITLLAALFHDIGKPAVCKEQNGVRHFYAHGPAGAKITDAILRRLRFDNDTREAVVDLVLRHDDILEPTKAGIRKILSKMGEEQMRRLLILREGDLYAHCPDRIDHGIANLKKARGYLEELLESEGRITLRELKLNGKDLMQMGVPAGKQMGILLNALLQQVLEGRIPNEKEVLQEKAREML